MWLVNDLGPRASREGQLSKDDFLKLALWKSKRPSARYRQNSEEAVREKTGTALKAPDEATRIQALRSEAGGLHGVDYPVASVILHFCHREPYPILDVRALESLNCPKPSSYNQAFWEEYVQYCRQRATSLGISMRDYDRALWAFSWDKAHTSQGGAMGSGP